MQPTAMPPPWKSSPSKPRGQLSLIIDVCSQTSTQTCFDRGNNEKTHSYRLENEIKLQWHNWKPFSVIPTFSERCLPTSLWSGLILQEWRGAISSMLMGGNFGMLAAVQMMVKCSWHLFFTTTAAFYLHQLLAIVATFIDCNENQHPKGQIAL